MKTITNLTKSRINIAGVDIEAGEQANFDDAKISPSMKEIRDGGGIKIEEAKAATNPDDA